MEHGNVVEYIDQQRILCAVVIDSNNTRLRVLTENNRELNLSEKRLSHKDNLRLDVSQGREKTVAELKRIANRRQQLIDQVDIKELWEVLNEEQQWIDLPTMTAFCFPDNPSGDHESAVVRAFFENRLYFKFSPDRFFPYSEEQVERLALRKSEALRRERLVLQGAQWLRSILGNGTVIVDDDRQHLYDTFVDVLKSAYLYEKDSGHFSLAQQMLAKAGIADFDQIFEALVQLGVWEPDENLDLLLLDIPQEFPEAVAQSAQAVSEAAGSVSVGSNGSRLDLTGLTVFTIDGQATVDFDDGLSLERIGDRWRIGIHIIDVGHFIAKGDAIDQEALRRSSSIYTPDLKIPMLPACLAEHTCSLKAGEVRPAISIRAWYDPDFSMSDFDISPSWVQVRYNYSYYEANSLIGENESLARLRDIAAAFRQFRLQAGAVQILLPEINVWLDDNGRVNLNQLNRESPSRMLVSELMIMGNGLMARFLADNQMAAIYRSQPKPKERLYGGGDQGTLFQNWMQRKLVSRFILDSFPESHSGLGLDAYVTATSPIRKYTDLVTQRQIKAALGLDVPYPRAEVDQIIQTLKTPMADVARLQYRRHRYWVLKYLEHQIGQKIEAIVLNRRRNQYRLLLTDYLIECDLAISSQFELKSEDMVQVVLQRVNARKDQVVIQLG